MDPITLIITAAIVLLVGLFAFHKGFREMITIRFNKKVKEGTTAVERQENEYNRLMKLLPQQQEQVASVMASATTAAKDLEAAKKSVDEAERDFNLADETGASEELLLELASKWDEAKENVKTMTTLAEEAAAAEDEAEAALDATTKALGKFSKQIERDRAKEKLAGALRTTAKARQQARDMRSQIGEVQQASREVDHNLEQARAANELAKGSSTEREMEAIREKASAKDALEALRAKRKAGATE